GMGLGCPSELAAYGSLRTWWLGRVAYAHALDLQEAIVRDHAAIGDTLLLLEHEPVYTTGRGGKPDNLPPCPGGVPVFRVGRGGDATYHGPGQLIGYPLIDLRARGGDVHRYLRALESALVSIVEMLGIPATGWPGRTGVWTGPPGRLRKLSSIGIG